MTLDGVEGAENVGIVMAHERGFFHDVGLDVWAGAPLDPSRPVQYVSKGIVDLGVAQQPQVVIGKEKGASVVAVGSLISRPTEVLMWLKGSGIRGIADLEGKTIAFPGIPFQKSILETVLARAGLTLEDVQLRNVGYELVPALLNDQADAIFGGSWNLEGAEPELRKANPVVIRLQDLGVPAYEGSVVIARSDLVDEDPQLIRKFMSAVARGNAAAIADPVGASNAIKKAIGARPDLNRRAREAELKATLPLISSSGYMSPDQAEGLTDWMFEEGLIRRKWPSQGLLTNAYR